MPLDPSRAIGAYAAFATLACAWLALSGTAAPNTKFTEIDVQRINVREPDGTLRLIVSNTARAPGAIVAGKEYVHPTRKTAGLLFYNEQGTENGGLIWDGQKGEGKRTSSGSLTFDRNEQDQTIQLVGEEDGAMRRSALIVNDRPEGAMDFARAVDIVRMPPGAARDAAARAANLGGVQRAFVGRQTDGAAQVVLRDPQGRRRLVMSVGNDGIPRIQFMGPDGKVTRTVGPWPVTIAAGPAPLTTRTLAAVACHE